jgi:hypothetical protein
MKTTCRLCFTIVFFAAQATLAGESVNELAQRLEAIMLHAERPDPEIVQEIASATPEQRRQLVAAVLRIVEPALRAPQPWNDANFRRIGVSASALAAASDDDAILATFGSNLSQVGFILEPSVILALSACRDPKAIEVMADLARLRFKEIQLWLPGPPPPTITEDQKRMVNDAALSFLNAVRGLASSRSGSGKVIAQKFRDDFVRLYDKSPAREEILRALEGEIGIDPLLRGTVDPVLSRVRASAAASPSSSEEPRSSKSEKPKPATHAGQEKSVTGIRAAIVPAIVSLVLLGLLIWFLRKK